MQVVLTGRLEEIFVDDEDLDLVIKHNWYLNQKGYAQANVLKPNGPKTTIRMHRLILGVTNPQIKVDHRFGNRLDNRRKNLRLCTNSQNLANRGINKNNTSGYKGVFYCKYTERWIAQLKYQSYTVWLGRHDTPELAALAYNSKAVELFGEFAAKNKVPNV